MTWSPPKFKGIKNLGENARKLAELIKDQDENKSKDIINALEAKQRGWANSRLGKKRSSNSK